MSGMLSCGTHLVLYCCAGQVGLFSLGIIPYINASIVLQLMSAAFPALKKMQREDGPQGRAKFQYYQKLAAFVFAIGQVGTDGHRDCAAPAPAPHWGPWTTGDIMRRAWSGSLWPPKQCQGRNSLTGSGSLTGGIDWQWLLCHCSQQWQ
jgi:hypothetical protein